MTDVSPRTGTGISVKQYRKWDYWSALEVAQKYSTATEFREGCRAAYSWARRNDCLDLITEQYKKYTLEKCLEVAKDYAFIGDFRREHRAHYHNACRLGYLSDAVAHMKPKQPEGRTRDNNVVYAWEVLSAERGDIVMPLPGYHLCKVGVTSKHIGEERARQCASLNKMAMRLIGVAETEQHGALDIERELLAMGTDGGVPYYYSGYTEFRLFSSWEVAEIASLLST